MAKKFTSTKRGKKKVEFSIDDEDYTFTPPKMARLVPDLFDGEDDDEESRGGAAKAAMDWLSDGLPDEQAARLKERLTDPDDDFDVPDLTEVTKWLIKQASGRPT